MINLTCSSDYLKKNISYQSVLHHSDRLFQLILFSSNKQLIKSILIEVNKNKQSTNNINWNKIKWEWQNQSHQVPFDIWIVK